MVMRLTMMVMVVVVTVVMVVTGELHGWPALGGQLTQVRV